VFALAAVAAGAAAVFALVPPREDGEYRPRSGGSLPQIWLYCIAPGATPKIVGSVLLGATAPTLTCKVDHDLQIAYSRGSEGPDVLQVIAESSDGTRRAIAPLQLDQRERLQSSVTQAALPYSARWTGSGAAGRWRVTARLSGSGPEVTLQANLEVAADP
jgi:hypothetical protein